MNKHLHFLISFAALLITSACQQRSVPPPVQIKSSPGIINGKPVDKTHPSYWMTARILQDNGGVWSPVCTASILSKDLILTAAHCVESSKSQELRIGFDAQPLSYEDQQDSATRVDVLEKFKTIAVKDFVIHPKYGVNEYDHDIALLYLESEIPAEFKAAPLLSAKQIKTIQEKQTYQVLLVGFGKVSEQPHIDSRVLRETTVPARFEGFHLITDQTGGTGGCNGDSGGPAYLKIADTLYLVGVTHGPTTGVFDCKHEGVWGNPNFDKAFLNKAAKGFGSKSRF